MRPFVRLVHSIAEVVGLESLRPDDLVSLHCLGPHYCRLAVVLAPRFDVSKRFWGADVLDPSDLATASSGCGSGES